MNKRGFTLIETLIYIAIISMVLISVVVFISAIADSRNKAYAAAETQSNGRTAINTIASKIMSATSVVAPGSGATSSVLILAMPSGGNITFAVVGGVLQMGQVGSATTTITGSRVTIGNLQFTNVSASGKRSNILVDLAISYNGAVNDKIFSYSQTLSTAVSIRK